MKKQSGFTLIELMVVMAIIAILATAGLSAYTGYIKKARDTKRIADVAALNTIMQGSLGSDGRYPPFDWDDPQVDIDNSIGLIKASNNGKRIIDPLTVGTVQKSLCYNSGDGITLSECGYTIFECDGRLGYMVIALFESKSSLPLYKLNASGNTGEDPTYGNYYDVGSCKVTNTSLSLDSYL